MTNHLNKKCIHYYTRCVMQMVLKKIKKVFVDREHALNFLERELNARIGEATEKAIRITQAPGTGKTRLLKEFIKKMERERKAIGIYINSLRFADWFMGDITDLQKMLRRAILSLKVPELVGTDVMISNELAKTFLKKHKISEYFAYEELERIFKDHDTVKNTLIDVCGSIPFIIGVPIIFVFDEIQATIGVMTDKFQNAKGQGLFRQIIKLAADLIKISNVLVVLSGTNYKIMHFLGKLGSPLYEKSKEFRLQPLDAQAVEEFYDRIFGEPQNEVEEQLREWMVVNSNGVPRTMVWMAEALQNIDIKKVSKANIDDIIEKLDMDVMQNIDVSRIQDLMELEHGRELLEWVAYRSIIEKEIPILSLPTISYDEAEAKNVCTVDDLIDKGIVHILDGNIEVRNNYYLMALWNELSIHRGMLIELLKLSGLKNEDALRLLSWQLNVLGAYFEIAVALAIYKFSQFEDFNLATLFDYRNDMQLILPKLSKLERVPISFISPQFPKDVIYAVPKAPGVDIITKTIENTPIYIQCKNWSRKISQQKLEDILKAMQNFESKFGTGIKVLVLSQKLDAELQEFASQHGLYTITDVQRLLGRELLEFFETARKRSQEVEPLIRRIEAGREFWFLK